MYPCAENENGAHFTVKSANIANVFTSSKFDWHFFSGSTNKFRSLQKNKQPESSVVHFRNKMCTALLEKDTLVRLSFVNFARPCD